jgi:anaerobic dimethyl sulfoxide reductase subunit B (iron-sulfur subunit)
MVADYGILIDYHWCTGCHSCEMACQMEFGYPIGQVGVKVFEVGPWQIEGDTWQFDFAPVFTDMCDGCTERVSQNKLPACVHHCQAKCMTYGRIDELAGGLKDHKKQQLYSL